MKLADKFIAILRSYTFSDGQIAVIPWCSLEQAAGNTALAIDVFDSLVSEGKVREVVRYGIHHYYLTD